MWQSLRHFWDCPQGCRFACDLARFSCGTRAWSIISCLRTYQNDLFCSSILGANFTSNLKASYTSASYDDMSGFPHTCPQTVEGFSRLFGRLQPLDWQVSFRMKQVARIRTNVFCAFWPDTLMVLTSKSSFSAEARTNSYWLAGYRSKPAMMG